MTPKKEKFPMRSKTMVIVLVHVPVPDWARAACDDALRILMESL